MTTVSRTIAAHRSAALRLLAAGSLTLALAGCYRTTPVVQETYPEDYRQRHPITLLEREHSVDVFISRNRGGLNASQRADVLAFAQTWKRESSSGVMIEVPAGGPTGRAVNESMREIRSLLAAAGIPGSVIRTHKYPATGASLAVVKLNYTRLSAKAGPCGLWPKDIGPGGGEAYIQNYSYWNLGCASQNNLAVMVANPADLVQPRAEASGYEARRSVVMDKYRKGEAPSAAYTGYDTGKISDLGK